MSADRYTLDANILVYALDRESGAKHVRSQALLRRALFKDCFFTTQTLSETYNAINKRRPALASEVRTFMEELMLRAEVVSASKEDLREALAVHAKRPVQFWDAMLWATAKRHGCRTLVTEDVQDRIDWDGVRYVNPFHASEAELQPFL